MPPRVQSVHRASHDREGRRVAQVLIRVRVRIRVRIRVRVRVGVRVRVRVRLALAITLTLTCRQICSTAKRYSPAGSSCRCGVNGSGASSARSTQSFISQRYFQPAEMSQSWIQPSPSVQGEAQTSE